MHPVEVLDDEIGDRWVSGLLLFLRDTSHRNDSKVTLYDVWLLDCRFSKDTLLPQLRERWWSLATFLSWLITNSV